MYLSTAPLMPVDRSAQTEPTGSWKRCACRQTQVACRQIHTGNCLPESPSFCLLQVYLQLSTDAFLAVDRRRENLNTRSPYVSELGVSNCHDSPYLNTHIKGTLWSYFHTEAATTQNPSKVSREKIFLLLCFNRPSRQPKRHPPNGIEARLSISQASLSTDTCQDEA
ncbi:hypothetical protein Taro_032576 [Colocasia esculenta]|uniref:Uncharacterized protein n=1 Tax=Colocasia esculenta TaxID=4460 RepID=A0A843W4C1_COLES|nr:hypothetical protein [Colocasia esculenta]